MQIYFSMNHFIKYKCYFITKVWDIALAAVSAKFAWKWKFDKTVYGIHFK